MNKLPKILPVWTNAAEQGLADLCRRLNDDSQYHPDFGGAGVDLLVNEDGVVSCVPLKCHDTKANKLCATNITLPFSAPNKGMFTESSPAVSVIFITLSQLCTYKRTSTDMHTTVVLVLPEPSKAHAS